MGGCVSSAAAENPPAVSLDKLRDEQLVKRYRVVQSLNLGKGNQGTVALAVRRFPDGKEGTEVAVKSISVGTFSTKLARDSAANEVACLQVMSHPNIVKLHDAFFDTKVGKVHLVMERIDGPRLSRLLASEMPKDPAEALSLRHSLITQLVDAVAHVHARGVIYRDLHPENTMAHREAEGRYTLKLIDFGSALPLRRSDRLGSVPALGSTYFQAPEVEKNLEYGQQADMWAVGVFSYLILCGDMPFSYNVHGIYQALHGQYYPLPETFDSAAHDFVKKLINVDPTKRMNASQCRRHRFLSRSAANKLKQSSSQESLSFTRVDTATMVLDDESMHSGGSASSLARPGSTHLGVAATEQPKIGFTVFDTIEAQKWVAHKIVELLSENLTLQQLHTVHTWLQMLCEQSVHNDASMRNAESAISMLNPANDANAPASNPESREGSVRGKPLFVRDDSLRAANMVRERLRESSVHARSQDSSLRAGSSGGPRIASLIKTVSTDSLDGMLHHRIRKGGMTLSIAHTYGLCTFGELLVALEANGHGRLAGNLETYHNELIVQRDVMDAAESQTESAESAVFRIADLFLAAEMRCDAQAENRSGPFPYADLPEIWKVPSAPATKPHVDMTRGDRGDHGDRLVGLSRGITAGPIPPGGAYGSGLEQPGASAKSSFGLPAQPSLRTELRLSKPSVPRTLPTLDERVAQHSKESEKAHGGTSALREMRALAPASGSPSPPTESAG